MESKAKLRCEAVEYLESHSYWPVYKTLAPRYIGGPERGYYTWEGLPSDIAVHMLSNSAGSIRSYTTLAQAIKDFTWAYVQARLGGWKDK